MESLLTLRMDGKILGRQLYLSPSQMKVQSLRLSGRGLCECVTPLLTGGDMQESKAGVVPGRPLRHPQSQPCMKGDLWPAEGCHWGPLLEAQQMKRL